MTGIAKSTVKTCPAYLSYHLIGASDEEVYRIENLFCPSVCLYKIHKCSKDIKK